MLGTLTAKGSPAPYIGERTKSNLVARALYDNAADALDELSFVKGDLLTVLEQNTGGLTGWWLCALRGRQGIAPGNRLRLLPGTYDHTGLGYGVGPSLSEPTGIDRQGGESSRRRSWHANPNKVVMPQKIGDVYVYDVPVSVRSLDEVDCLQQKQRYLGSALSLDSSYDTPTSSRTVATYDEPRVRSLITDAAYDVPRGSHDYDVPPEEFEYDFPVKQPPIKQPTTRSDNYVVPPSQLLRSNCSSGMSVFTESSSSSLSGSQSSLSTSLSLSSLCGSNRSSLEQPLHELYDIPPSEARRVANSPALYGSPSQVYDTPPAPRSVPPKPKVMEGVYDIPPQVTRDVALPRQDSPVSRRQSSSDLDSRDLALSLSGKELPISLDAAMEVLVNRQQVVQGSISKLFALIGNSKKEGEETSGCELESACRKLNASLSEFVAFAQSALANSMHAPDRSLGQKLGKLVAPLVESNATVQRTVTRSPEDVDLLVACARGLVEEVRHVASFIQGNSPLIFKRAQLISEQQRDKGLRDRPLPPVPSVPQQRPNDYDYVSLESKETVEKENAEIKATLPGELHKSFENLVIQSEIPVQEKPPHQADRQLLQFYGAQVETHSAYLDTAIEAFFQSIKGNKLPKVFVSHSKFVIISAHKLVFIGDTMRRNVSDERVQTGLTEAANKLCEALKTLVHNTKAAAQKFPSVEAVQEMVDSVVDISHLAKELRLCITRTP